MADSRRVQPIEEITRRVVNTAPRGGVPDDLLIRVRNTWVPELSPDVDEGSFRNVKTGGVVRILRG